MDEDDDNDDGGDDGDNDVSSLQIREPSCRFCKTEIYFDFKVHIFLYSLFLCDLILITWCKKTKRMFF